jgi:D-amino-acid dehydrogenase
VVANGVRRMGGEVRVAEVRAILTEGKRVVGVRCAGEDIAADQIVLAAGAWSARLLAPLGLKVPLETQRGYHVMLEPENVRFDLPVSPAERGFFITPMREGLRVAGTVELGQYDNYWHPGRAPTRGGLILNLTSPRGHRPRVKLWDATLPEIVGSAVDLIVVPRAVVLAYFYFRHLTNRARARA